MNNSNIYRISFVLLLAALSCKEHYTIPAKAIVNTNYLVVEGNINVGQDSTIIKLSRVTAITDTTKAIVPETGAGITVETDAGRSFTLAELGNGAYGISNIAIGAPTEKYRLNIKTAANKQYTSDYVEFKKAPPIDSVSWEQHDDGVHIYANTHDDANNTKYYKWDYIETWEYHSSLVSCCKYVNGGIGSWSDSDRPYYTCWQTIVSSAIITESTTKLASDVVYKKELMFIPTSSYKIGVLYSMLVKQTVLTEEGFNFWTGLSKNTEQLGSLFDAQPSQLQGNIHSVTNTAEPVIGFITASTTEQQRLWIKKVQVINWAYPPGPYQACDTVHLDPAKPDEFLILQGGSWVLIALAQPGNPFSPWVAAPIDCVDCRLKGGVPIKPPFWP